MNGTWIGWSAKPPREFAISSFFIFHHTPVIVPHVSLWRVLNGWLYLVKARRMLVYHEDPVRVSMGAALSLITSSRCYGSGLLRSLYAGIMLRTCHTCVCVCVCVKIILILHRSRQPAHIPNQPCEEKNYALHMDDGFHFHDALTWCS